jgi:hypothetical protein
MTLPSYDEAFARSLDKPPFSNGDEGYGWMWNNCDRCVHDKPAREDHPEDGCPLILLAMIGRTPAEWLDQKRIGPKGPLEPYGIADQYRCMYFRSEDDGPDPEPCPVPDPPGQLCLMPREPFEGTRMFGHPRYRRCLRQHRVARHARHRRCPAPQADAGHGGRRCTGTPAAVT